MAYIKNTSNSTITLYFSGDTYEIKKGSVVEVPDIVADLYFPDTEDEDLIRRAIDRFINYNDIKLYEKIVRVTSEEITKALGGEAKE